MSRKVTPTYTLLNEVTLAAATSTITFSRIPQNYADLIVSITYYDAASPSRAVLRLNGDSGANYPLVYLDGPAATGSQNNTWMSFGYYSSGADSSRPNSHSIQLFDYSTVDKHKNGILRGGNANDRVSAYVMRWTNTSAITSLTITLESGGNFLSNSRFFLYGVVA